MARRRSAAKAQALWLDLATAAVATSITLSVRLSRIASGTLTPREGRRMLNEKAAAALEGSLAVANELARRAGRRGPRDPVAALAESVALLDVATRPARRRVRANAKRLTSGKSLNR